MNFVTLAFVWPGGGGILSTWAAKLSFPLVCVHVLLSPSVFFQTVAAVPGCCCWQLDGCPDQQKHIRNIDCEGTHLCWSKINEKYGCDRRQVWRRRTGLVGVKRNLSWCMWLANRNFRTFFGSLFLNLAVFVMLGHLKAVYCYEARRAGHVKTGHCGKVTRTRKSYILTTS